MSSKRAIVIIDYQNIHLTGHEQFAQQYARHTTLVHPLHFANQVIQARNSRIAALRMAGRPDLPPDAALTAVVAYRGLPSNKHEAKSYQRNQAHQSNWTRDPRVTVHHRPLAYHWDSSQSRHVGREKGIDVLAALHVVRAAPDYDVVILASHDTDLEPALEHARGFRASIETAGWFGCKQLRHTQWRTMLNENGFINSRDWKTYG